MKSKIITAFALFCVTMILFPIVVFPVVADEVEMSRGFYRFPWGNGVDDDFDGVIDNIGEPDVFYGEVNVSDNANVIVDTWTNDFIFPELGMPKGVCLGGVFEELWNIESSSNHSVSPTQTARYLDLNYFGNMSFADKTNVLNVVMFYVNISPQFIMNGASQLWYRSPLAWDNTTYQGTQHYLNIYDEDDNLVYASTDSDVSLGYGSFISRIPDPKILVDKSGNFSSSQMANMTGWYSPHTTTNNRSYYNRSYFQLNMNFKTGERYRFEEYIKTQGNVAINNVTLFMARSQDILGDNETTTYVFWDTPYARNIPVECSWGLVATLGKGRVGSELLIISDEDYGGIFDKPSLITHRFSGDQTVTNAASIKIIIPLRTSKPLNITVSCQYWSGASHQGWFTPVALHMTGITGTLFFTLDLPMGDIDPTEPNDYQLMLTLDNFNTTGDAMTVGIFPSISGGETDTCMFNRGMFEQTEVYYFAMDVQLQEETVATGTKNQGTDLLEYIIGASLIIAAILLAFTIIGTPISVTIIAGTLTIGEFLAIAPAVTVGVITLGTLGTLLMIHSFTGEGIQSFIAWAASGLIRVLTAIYDGARAFLGSIWDFGVALWEVVKYIGEQALKWGSIILDAILQIIWFIAFLIVIMLWSAFLVSMKYIAKGDVDGALRALFRPVKKPLVLLERQSYRAAKGTTKTQKWWKKVKKQSSKGA
jgi:hypothetical protein